MTDFLENTFASLDDGRISAVSFASKISAASAGDAVTAVAAEDDVFSRLAAFLRTPAMRAEIEDRDVYAIGEMTEYLGVSLRTLRFYEQSGLIRPTRIGSRRLYSRQNRDRLVVIVALREVEASLVAIKSLLLKLERTPDLAEATAAIEGLLVAILSSNQDRVAELNRTNRSIDGTLQRLNRLR